jgi:nucleoside-diphosphate-sugar epimerase
VTGGLGWTALPILKALAKGGLEPAVLDLPGAEPPDDDPIHSQVEVVRGDVASFSDALGAIRDAFAVVHLAIEADPKSYARPDRPFDVNVKGTANVFEAARRAGAATVVLMSSAPVHLELKPGKVFDAEKDWRSDPGKGHLLDLTRRLQEAIARDYAETFGSRAVALRAGHVVDGRDEVDSAGTPLAQVQEGRGGWVCRHDLARAAVKALAYDKPGYSAFHVVGSREAAERFDAERAERLLGFRFKRRFEEYPPRAAE